MSTPPQPTARRQIPGRLAGPRLAGAFAVVAFAGVTAPSLPARATTYVVTEIAPLAGQKSFSSSEAWGCDSAGRVVGVSNPGGGSANDRAFLFDGTHATDLGPGRAYAMNDAGQVAGASGGVAVVWQGGGVTVVGTVGGTRSEALAINSLGQVAGWSEYDPNSVARHEFFWDPTGGINDLGSLAISGAGATALDDNGDVAGISLASATYYDAGTGTTIAIGTLGGTNAAAYGMNNSQTIVGQSNTKSGALHAFLYSGGAMQDIGTLPGSRTQSAALAINDDGDVVGFGNTPGVSDEHAFLYSGGVMIDLNDAIPPNSGWVLSLARGLSSSGGYICGSGWKDGYPRAFLLTPQ